MVLYIKDAKDLIEILLEISKKIHHYFEPFKPEFVSQIINCRNNSCEIKFKLVIESGFRRKLSKIKIPYDQNLSVKEISTLYGTPVDNIVFQLDKDSWVLDPSQLPSSTDDFIITLEGILHPGFIKNLINITPSKEKDMTDEENSYWLDVQIGDIRAFEKIIRLYDIDVVVNVSFYNSIKIVLPTKWINEIKKLRDILYNYQSTPINQIMSSYSEIYYEVSRIEKTLDNMTTEPGFRKYFSATREIGGPFFINETINSSLHKLIAENVIVNTNTYLTIKEPHSMGYLIFKKKKFVEDAQKSTSIILKLLCNYTDRRESRGERKTFWCGIRIMEEYAKSHFLKKQCQSTLNL